MFPVHLMKNKEAVLLFLIGTCVATISYVNVYYIPLYFQFTRGDTALETALRMLPFIILLIVFILSSGFLMSWFGYYKPWYIGGSAIALIGSVLLCKYIWSADVFYPVSARMDVDSSVSAFYGFEALVGIGAGAYTQANFAVIQPNVDVKDAGAGITLMLTGTKQFTLIPNKPCTIRLVRSTNKCFSSTLRSLFRSIDCWSYLPQRCSKFTETATP